MSGNAGPDDTGFAACVKCPTGEACTAAGFCVLESRFSRADRTIGELTCRTCGRGSESAWACLVVSPCDAQSALWGQWWLVRLYANDARAAAAAADVDDKRAQYGRAAEILAELAAGGAPRELEHGNCQASEASERIGGDPPCSACVDQAAAAAVLALEDDWAPCRHDCDDGCFDEYGRPDCRHEHCWNCGGCGCPGYCDDYQTYNLRPDETGGAAASSP